jgi:polyisoprenoid-binding protein YceI
MRLTPIFVFGAILSLTGVACISMRVAAAPAASKPSLAGVWTIDPLHTQVDFTIQHMLISEVQGRFADLGGTIVADPANLRKSSVNFTIQAASIDTQVAMRDKDLRSKTYFDVDTYPTITFVSTKIVKARPGSADPYLAYGNLTIKGVTQPIVLPFTINGPIIDPRKTPRFGLLSHITIDRTKFGVGGAGSAMLGTNVKIDISLEATPAKKAG